MDGRLFIDPLLTPLLLFKIYRLISEFAGKISLLTPIEVPIRRSALHFQLDEFIVSLLCS